MTKNALRKELSLRRAAAHNAVDPLPAYAALEDAIGDREGPISFYWPIRTEIDPRPVMNGVCHRHDVCLPVTNGYAPLVFRPWRPGAEMKTDDFGVSVPSDGPEVEPKVLVLPMLGFDNLGNRLGYGAGHYDRTLDKLRAKMHVVAIGFAYEAQLVEELPTEPTDEPLDIIVTEAKTRHFMR